MEGLQKGWFSEVSAFSPGQAMSIEVDGAPLHHEKSEFQVLYKYYTKNITLQILHYKYYTTNITLQILHYKYYITNVTSQILLQISILRYLYFHNYNITFQIIISF
jgi:hypothetical protein